MAVELPPLVVLCITSQVTSRSTEGLCEVVVMEVVREVEVVMEVVREVEVVMEVVREVEVVMEIVREVEVVMEVVREVVVVGVCRGEWLIEVPLTSQPPLAAVSAVCSWSPVPAIPLSVEVTAAVEEGEMRTGGLENRRVVLVM